MQEFITAAKALASDGDDEDSFGFDVEFAIVDERLKKDDPGHRRVMVAKKPSDGQLTVFMALAGDDLAANSEVLSTSINFLYSLLAKDDRRYFRRRLLDMDDPFGAEDVAEILYFILGEWTGKATGSPTDSPRSQRPSGQRSTTRQRKTA